MSNITLDKNSGDDSFEWTAGSTAQAVALFILAGVAEIGGGYLVWIAIRGNKSWWYALVGSLVLILYGFIPCLQPTENFGRIYAAYGGFFIVLSFLFGWAVDGEKPDKGDVIGGCVSMVGVGVILFWPRVSD
jgi:drug/metabolite transporter superfamily protein YnfA